MRNRGDGVIRLRPTWNHKKKGKVHRAIKFTGDNYDEILEFAGEYAYMDKIRTPNGMVDGIIIRTPLGDSCPGKGTWILEDLPGCYYIYLEVELENDFVVI